MGRIWGPGGWVGPGSRLENRTYLRGFRFLLSFLLGSLVVFLLGYFGWSSDRTEHELLPSLLRAVLGGVFWGWGWPPTWSGLTVGRDGNEETTTAAASAVDASLVAELPTAALQVRGSIGRVVECAAARGDGWTRRSRPAGLHEPLGGG